MSRRSRRRRRRRGRRRRRRERRRRRRTECIALLLLRDVLVPPEQPRVLFADLDLLPHVGHSPPLEEAKLPQDEADDDHDEEPGHDGDDHDPDGDVGDAFDTEAVGEGHDAEGGLVVWAVLLGGQGGGQLQPGGGGTCQQLDLLVLSRNSGEFCKNSIIVKILKTHLPGPCVDDDTINMWVVLHQGGVPHSTLQPHHSILPPSLGQQTVSVTAC